MKEKILALARVLGQVTQEETALEPLCEAAEAELRARLREDVTPEDCEGAFVQAGAWLALEALEEGRRADGVASWTAGDLTVRRRESGAGTGALRRMAMRLMAPYLRDGGFCFLGVDG